MRKPELLAPAGDLTKLRYAIDYGADAVYLGASRFSLRTASANFTVPELQEGLRYAHERGKKCYLACNVYPRDAELGALEELLQELRGCRPDAIILSDPGVLLLVRKHLGDIPIHISTQANTVNALSARFWYDQGASRIILARELSLREIATLRNSIPDALELEAFVHGAMCVSYSGRCLLSSYLTGRDANRGACAQPCRWEYTVMEQKRPGQYFPIEQNEHGTFLFNAKDLCMIDHIGDLIAAGITSLKMEGRVKTEYYVATVTAAYRRAIDRCCDTPGNCAPDPALYEEVCKVSHRAYSTGFFYGDPGPEGQIYTDSSYIRDYEVAAVVEGYDPESGRVTCRQKNRFCAGDQLELLAFTDPFVCCRADDLRNVAGDVIDCAPHPEMICSFLLDYPAKPGMLLRRALD